MPKRRHHRSPNLHGSRHTVVIPGYDGGLFDELYPRMLIEDVGLRIMPVEQRWTDRAFSVDLEPSSEHIESLLSAALDPGGHGSLTDAVCSFVRETAQTVMVYGRAIQESVFLRDEAGELAGIEFAYVPPDSITIDGGLYLQRVPADLATQWGIAREVRGPASTLMVFDSPLNPETLRRMLTSLAEVGRPVLPDFVEKQMLGEENIGYSPMDEIRFKQLALAEASREIGWDMRSMFSGDDYFLEYYAIVRRLRFERFLIRFRDRVIDQLNEYLGRVEDVIGAAVRLKLTGLPTGADVDAAEASLAAGPPSFRELLEPFAIR
jgi:hypothetical protein